MAKAPNSITLPTGVYVRVEYVTEVLKDAANGLEKLPANACDGKKLASALRKVCKNLEALNG